eukprot:Mrub_08125.p1 GENE.Mrub_08125~~Mrub_08125.p1  ORF type:complete len:238 (-),score=11.03 Mrub_08125:148-804(-)
MIEVEKGKYASDVRLSQCKFCLYNYNKLVPPKSSNKPTLVLDLDHTLIYASETPIAEYDFVIPIFKNKKLTILYVKKRPYLDQFLERLSHYYELIVFSAATPAYAELVVEKIDLNQVIDYRLYRYACSSDGSNLFKDLSYLGRDLSNTIIIDDSPQNFIKQPQNGLLIYKYKGDTNDNHLEMLINYLLKIKDYPNVRDQLINFQYQNAACNYKDWYTI